jgi:glycosyltransferase involved in cell wall biosynthesis
VSGPRPSILHIIPHDGIGGVEVAARSMAGGTSLPCRFRLLLLAGRAIGGAADSVIESPFRSPLNPFAQLRAVRACLRERPDLVIISLWRSVPVAVLLRLLRPRIRIAFFLHSEHTVHAVDTIASRLAIAVADEVWADSNATLRARLQRSAKPAQTICFVTERLSPVTSPVPRPRFVSWSRLTHEKGIDRALCFVAKLSEAGIDARFEIWGPDAGEEAALKRRAAELGISERVLFRGAFDRDRLRALAIDSSFFLMLSRYEGMAMGTVEAMQLGLVPIVTPVGEMARYVRDRDNGLLVDPDRLDEGAAKVSEVLQDAEAFATLRGRAIEHWQQKPLYAEDVCRAASELLARQR